MAVLGSRLTSLQSGHSRVSGAADALREMRESTHIVGNRLSSLVRRCTEGQVLLRRETTRVKSQPGNGIGKSKASSYLSPVPRRSVCWFPSGTLLEHFKSRAFQAPFSKRSREWNRVRRTFIGDPAQFSVECFVQTESEVLQRFPHAFVHQIRKHVRVWHLHSRRWEAKSVALLRGRSRIANDQNLLGLGKNGRFNSVLFI